ncbi:MAG: hypothetical protein ABIQ18_17505 [Umezawaea sp.]
MNDLDTAMKDVAEHVDVPAHFTAAVLRGGKRRLARRRRTVAAAVVAVMGVVGVGVSAVQQYGPFSDSRLAVATQGDLAGDRALVEKAIEIWKGTTTLPGGQPLDGEPAGDPYAYWAGSTPAGNAVVVVQDFVVSGKAMTRRALVATDPADGVMKLVGLSAPRIPDATESAFQFGPGDRTFLTVHGSQPAFVSPTVTRQADGQVRRDWTRLSANGGVSVWTAPDGVDLSGVRLVANHDSPTAVSLPERVLFTRRASVFVRDGLLLTINEHDVSPLNYPWTDPTDKIVQVGVDPANLPQFGYGMEQALLDAGMVDVRSPIRGEAKFVRSGVTSSEIVDSVMWRIHDTFTNGDGLQVAQVFEEPGTTVFEEPGTTRLYAIISNHGGTPTKVVRGPDMDPDSPLPVKMRLPDGKGWVVGAYGANLRYRNSESAQWQELATSGGLLPDDTTQVQVTPKAGGEGQVVALPR